jgi:hypothetical protein
MIDDDYAHLIGHRFPGGRYRLASYVSWLWADAVEATPNRAFAHPGIAYMVGLHGGGASITEIMDLLDADADSGVMFGEIELEFAGPLRPEQEYDVEGEVLAVERKRGRRAGVFDRVTFAHRISEIAGPRVAQVTHTWIFPRSEPGA